MYDNIGDIVKETKGIFMEIGMVSPEVVSPEFGKKRSLSLVFIVAAAVAVTASPAFFFGGLIEVYIGYHHVHEFFNEPHTDAIGVTSPFGSGSSYGDSLSVPHRPNFSNKPQSC